MIKVNFSPPLLTDDQRVWWDRWEPRANAATDAVIAAWESWFQDPDRDPKAKFQPVFDERVWKDLRDWLSENIFHRKCAYCETFVARATFHAEHFRPKGKVRFRRNGEARLVSGLTPQEWLESEAHRSVEIPHPGYFWLAYNWRNLLPSCEFCNTAAGKKDQFPVRANHVLAKRIAPPQMASLTAPVLRSPTWQDVCYLQPPDLDAFEDRLLIHPYFDDPDDHLIFGHNGIVAARNGSEKGQQSILVFNLNDEELICERTRVQVLAQNRYLHAMAEVNGTWEEKLSVGYTKVVDSIRSENEAYCAAALAAVAIIRRGWGIP